MDANRPPDELDFDNPYAPPKSTFTPEIEPPYLDFAGIPFSIESIVSTSWSIFKQNLGPCLWVFWGVFMINMGLAFMLGLLLNGLQIAMAGNPQSFMILNYGLNFVSFIIQVWLAIGMNRGLIKIVRGERLSFDVLFSGGQYLLTTILASIVVGFLVFAAAIVPAMVMTVTMATLRNLSAAAGVVFVACCVLFACLILYVCARLMQFYFLVIDRNAGVFESIGTSWQITRGRVGTIILVYLMQFICFVAGVLALCVGLVFTLPLSSLLLVVTYLAMIGPVKSPDPAPLMRWEEDL